MHSILQDLKGGVRNIFRNPGLSAMVILTLAVGIGAGTSIFSVVNGVLFKPLPVPNQDRLLAVWAVDVHGDGPMGADVSRSHSAKSMSATPHDTY